MFFCGTHEIKAHTYVYIHAPTFFSRGCKYLPVQSCMHAYEAKKYEASEPGSDRTTERTRQNGPSPTRTPSVRRICHVSVLYEYGVTDLRTRLYEWSNKHLPTFEAIYAQGWSPIGPPRCTGIRAQIFFWTAWPIPICRPLRQN